MHYKCQQGKVAIELRPSQVHETITHNTAFRAFIARF